MSRRLARPPLADVRGDELAALTQSDRYLQLKLQHVAASPGAAIARIESVFGALPLRLGSNVPGIVGIREAVWATSRDSSIANGLMIIAPHTHWRSAHPILISAVDCGYRLLPQPPEATRRYVPVSFFFSPEGPVPYEWVDDSISFERGDLEAVWRAIGAVCEELADKAWPLGLSLNFRFKALLSDDSISTLELPEDPDNPPEGASLVRRAEDVLRSHDASEFEQVAWHAYCDRAESLRLAELDLIASIRRQFDAIESDADVSAVARELLQTMRRLSPADRLPPSDPG